MSLGIVDFAVVAAYFAITIAIGFWSGRGERSTHDFFLGGRRQHWLLAGVSIIATEVSAVTLIAVPAEAFAGNWWYLQMYAGAFLGRALIVYLLLPAFYGGEVTTVYQYLGQRFGPWTRTTASIMFFASRVIGSGMRLLLASLALAVIFDVPLTWVVVISAGVAALYATYGGIKAILWTDAFQAFIFVCAAIVAICMLFWLVPGHWTQQFGEAWYNGKLKVFTWDTNPNNARAFWVLLIHATILNMAALGVDQDLTQRMLTCRNLREGRKSLIFNMFAGFPIPCIFLMIGSLLFVYYDSMPQPLPDPIIQKNERVFPYFITTALPHNVGLKGLLVSAILAAAMSSLSSALGALSSTAVTDFYRVITRNQRSEQRYLLAARIFTAAFAAVLIFVALAFSRHDGLLEQVFSWVSLVFGGMLGIFLLGVTTRSRGHDRINTVAMISSSLLLIVLKYVQESRDVVWIAWPWWIVIGTAWTYFFAILFRTAPERPATAT